MIPITAFPASPSLWQVYSVGNKSFQYNGTTWELCNLTNSQVAGTGYPMYRGGILQPDAQTPLVYEVKRVMTRAEMLALNTTPVTLVAAPGAGKMFIGLGLLVFTKYNQIAYAGGGNVGLKVNGVYVSAILAAGSIAVAANRIEYAMGAALSSVVDTTLVNQALVLQSTVDFTSAAEDVNNKCSTVTFTARYAILSVA